MEDADSSPEVIASEPSNGAISEHEELESEGVDEELCYSASRRLRIGNETNSTPYTTTSSDPNNASSASPKLLTRRGARRIPSSSPPVTEQLETRPTSIPIQFLRPITPTQPLMGDELHGTSLRTPTTTDMLLHDGPMTPTNNAGPFVFDGSAGRAGGCRIANNLSSHTEVTAPDA